MYGLKRARQRGDVAGDLTQWSAVFQQAVKAPEAQETLAGLIWYMMVKIQGLGRDRMMRWLDEIH